MTKLVQNRHQIGLGKGTGFRRAVRSFQISPALAAAVLCCEPNGVFPQHVQRRK